MPEGPLGFERLTELGPFVSGECDDVKDLTSPIEVMAPHYEMDPVLVAREPEEMAPKLRGLQEILEPGEVLAIHHTGEEEAERIVSEGFDKPVRSGFGSKVREEAVFSWIHKPDMHVLGGYPYVISVVESSKALVGDFDMFYLIEGGDVTPEEYEDMLVPLDKYVDCVAKGKFPNDRHTADNMFGFRL